MVVFDLGNTYSTIVGEPITFSPVVMNLRKTWTETKAAGFGKYATKLDNEKMKELLDLAR